MSLNYSFIIELANRHAQAPARFLDFGCGAAEVALLAQQAGFEAYGADTFLGIGDSANNINVARARIGSRACQIVPGQPLAFADAHFDVVVSNYVFEHIEDFPKVVPELARITRPGGILLALMPTSEILWEAHLRMPLIHRLQNGSALQRRAIRFFRRLGLGMSPEMGAKAWEDYTVNTLRDVVWHRSLKTYLSDLAPAFHLRESAEPSWARYRVARHRVLRHAAPLVAGSLLDGPLRTLVQRMAGVVLVLERTSNTAVAR